MTTFEMVRRSELVSGNGSFAANAFARWVSSVAAKKKLFTAVNFFDNGYYKRRRKSMAANPRFMRVLQLFSFGNCGSAKIRKLPELTWQFPR